MTIKTIASCVARLDTQNRNCARKTCRQVRFEAAPPLLPVAHDPLTARIIELAGYPAYQIGDFALGASRFALVNSRAIAGA
jgi:hypothetical protein